MILFSVLVSSSFVGFTAFSERHIYRIITIKLILLGLIYTIVYLFITEAIRKLIIIYNVGENRVPPTILSSSFI